jgi:hypothetical protein
MKFPALVNAHDHLELNHYPRTKYRERYDNAREWAADVNAHLNESPFRELRAHSLRHRLFIGGLKNLLCGALFVMHHNPPHNMLFSDKFPVSVVRYYSWTHSIYYWEQGGSSDRFYDCPHFIHLAEGTDKYAHCEYRWLREHAHLGSGNYVFIHGVGLTESDILDAQEEDIRGLVVCPTTNSYLLGKTAAVEAWVQAGGRVTLGSDSRLTADGDLLEEIALSRKTFPPYIVDLLCDPENAAAILGIMTDDELDYFIAESFPQKRSEIQLIVRNGIPQIGDPDAMSEHSKLKTIACTLDGVPKRMNIKLARQVAACSLKEPGLELDEIPQRRTWF